MADPIPTTEHFAIVTTDTRSIHHEGDERSRTHPGHGYPAYTETVETISYKAFTTEAELLAYLERFHASASSKPFRVLHVRPMKVSTTVRVAVEPLVQQPIYLIDGERLADAYMQDWREARRSRPDREGGE